jgi:hypothetical protein
LFYPLYLSMLLSLIAGLYILISWNENNLKIARITNPEGIQSQSFITKIHYSWGILRKDKPLFSVGIIESSFKICISLWAFIWTPLLEETSGTFINVGVIYACFMMSKLIGCELYDGLKKILKTNTYLITLFLTVTSCASFYIDYSIQKFNIRLISLMYFDGTLGAFVPLMSSLKSQMIPEGQRTTIMTFFRVPINVVCILCLLFSTYLTTAQICLVGFGILVISTITTLFLFAWHIPPDCEKRILLTTTEIKQDHLIEEEYFKKDIEDDKNQ